MGTTAATDLLDFRSNFKDSTESLQGRFFQREFTGNRTCI